MVKEKVALSFKVHQKSIHKLILANINNIDYLISAGEDGTISIINLSALSRKKKN
jgi:hypothetical protein